MINSLWLGAASMTAQQLKVDSIASNLANVNTTGYKRGRVNFQELVYVTGGVGSTAAAAPVAGTTPGAGTVASAGTIPYGPVQTLIGTGIRPAGVERLQGQGILQATSVETDLGLDGEGYFAVTTESGETLYTRDGHFSFDAQGNLVTADGDPVVIEAAAPLPAGAKNLSIAQDGAITATVDGEEQPRALGRIQIYRFSNPGGLEATGRNLFRTTQASGQAVAQDPASGAITRVRQGYLEASNVSLIDEMVGLMEAQRAYEMGAKIVQNADTLLGIANSLRR